MLTLKTRAIAAARYPSRSLNRALVHYDRGNGRALCYAQRELLIDNAYEAGPVTCQVCIRKFEQLNKGAV